jgi:tagaturonate epimerase
MQLSKYSFGTGDRFGLQGSAQLEAIQKAEAAGVELAIVWNKSFREHCIVGTSPQDVRREADEAVRAASWNGNYHVDADHINLQNVEQFLPCSDFFTIDVADYIGVKASEGDLAAFAHSCSSYIGELHIDGIAEPLTVTRDKLLAIGENYLFAMQQAAAIYRHIVAAKGVGNFITEVSIDETTSPQKPEELFFVLAALAQNGVPIQTIAPKFTGRFNKGVDYQGDVAQFNREFSDDVCVIKKAISALNLPSELKLSVHSGSDKFSIYPGIRKAIEQHKVGVHIKTAGTTWLEELIGLAEAGGESLDIVRQIYRKASARFDELCQPYAAVIDIDRAALPTADEFDSWARSKISRTIQHDQGCPDYNSNVRQLLHVGYKIAAELGQSYLLALQNNTNIVAIHVRDNLLERHIRPLFL